MVDTVRTISALKALLADNAAGDISPQDLRDVLVSVAANTGWAQYSDTVYTSGSPLALVADTNTVLPNNAGTVIDTHKPPDVSSFYAGGKITGRNGDSLVITIDFVALPTSVNTTYLDVWFDIGGSIGELYRRVISFPKGNGVARPIGFTAMVYTLDTWQANGATVKVRANGSAGIYDIRYVIARVHRGSQT
ncbi:hypothetical protein EON76_05375 [bacterium]|nr:MAG: hypothetical protein EON76_05375 [bacterium]